jgi:tetratricopeptide (TPR) repeat protein
MSVKEKVNWLKRLGWDHNQLEDIRFVGYHYIRQGKYEIAQTFFEALIAIIADKPLDEQLPYDYETLGAIYLQLGDNIRSLRYLERSLQMDSNSLDAQLNKIKALIGLKRVHSAMKLAKCLVGCKDPIISDRAEALILAHQLNPFIGEFEEEEKKEVIEDSFESVD